MGAGKAACLLYVWALGSRLGHPIGHPKPRTAASLAARHGCRLRTSHHLGCPCRMRRPDTELWSHYFNAALPRQFDCVIHVDVTSAVQPLDGQQQAAASSKGKGAAAGRLAAEGAQGKVQGAAAGELPETWPSGA